MEVASRRSAVRACWRPSGCRHEHTGKRFDSGKPVEAAAGPLEAATVADPNAVTDFLSRSTSRYKIHVRRAAQRPSGICRLRPIYVLENLPLDAVDQDPFAGTRERSGPEPWGVVPLRAASEPTLITNRAR